MFWWLNLPADEGQEEKGNMKSCPINIKKPAPPQENNLHVEPDVMKHLMELAKAHGMTESKMANIILRRAIHPDGQPL